MRTAVDTNVILALWSGELPSSQISTQLVQARTQGGLVICASVYVELLAHSSVSQSFVDGFLADTSISVDFLLTEPVWRQSSRSFVAYAQRRRHSGGGSTNGSWWISLLRLMLCCQLINL